MVILLQPDNPLQLRHVQMGGHVVGQAIDAGRRIGLHRQRGQTFARAQAVEPAAAQRGVVEQAVQIAAAIWPSRARRRRA